MSSPKIGEKFHMLTFMGHVPGWKENRARVSAFLCECGVVSFKRMRSVTSGHSKSCGCLQRKTASEVRKTHGLTRISGGRRNPIYAAWQQMIRRCTSEKYFQYKDYGGRGISVCERWSSSFSNFISDMGEKPSPEMTIERIDNNGNYCPENCKWATRKEQARNRRSNVMLTFNGKTQCVTDWAEETGTKVTSVRGRIKSGIEDFESLFKKGQK